MGILNGGVGTGGGGPESRRFRLGRIPAIRPLLRSYFFAGVLVVVPLGVIAWIVMGFLRALWRLNDLLPDRWQPEAFIDDKLLASLMTLVLTVAIIVALAIGVSILGWISRQYLGQKVLEWVTELIQRIPVVRTVYSALDQLMRAVTSSGGKQFSRVVYAQFPHPGSWTIAFVTGPAKDPDPASGRGKYINIFVPTTPNPTSGFYMVVPETEVRETQLRVEEAFRTLISLGIANE